MSSMYFTKSSCLGSAGGFCCWKSFRVGRKTSWIDGCQNHHVCTPMSMSSLAVISDVCLFPNSRKYDMEMMFIREEVKLNAQAHAKPCTVTFRCHYS